MNEAKCLYSTTFTMWIGVDYSESPNTCCTRPAAEYAGSYLGYIFKQGPDGLGWAPVQSQQRPTSCKDLITYFHSSCVFLIMSDRGSILGNLRRCVVLLALIFLLIEAIYFMTCLHSYYWDQGFDSFVASTLHHDAEFIPAPTGFIGSRQGFVYKCGDQGVGYYLDSG